MAHYLFHTFSYLTTKFAFEKHSNSLVTVPYDVYKSFLKIDKKLFVLKEDDPYNAKLKSIFKDKAFNFKSSVLTETDGVELNLLITNRCNLNCNYCFAKTSYLGSQTLTPEFIDQTFDFFEHHQKKVKKIILFGGEPLLAIDCIKDLIKIMKRRQVTLQAFMLITNGTRITGDIADFLREHRIVPTVSIDGPSLIHDRLRRTLTNEPTHYLVCSSIENLIARQMKFGVEATYGREHLKHNFSIVDLIRYFQALGVKNCAISLEHGTDFMANFYAQDENVLELSEQFKEAAVYSLTSLATDNPIVLSYVFKVFSTIARRGTRKYICPAAQSSYTVMPNGSVYPCYLLLDDRYVLGKIGANTDNNSENFNLICNTFKTKPKSHFRECSSCWAGNLCFSCYGINFSESRKLGPPTQVFCEVFKATIEGTLAGIMILQEEGKLNSQFFQNIQDHG